MNPFEFTHIVVFILQLTMLGFLVACLELAFQMFMQRNMILFPWAILLSNVAHKNEVMRHLMRPLGRCRYCNAVWIAFYVYVFFYGYNLPVLLIVGITVLFVKVLSDSKWFKDVDPNYAADALYYEYDDVDINNTNVGFEVNDVVHTPWQAMLWSYLILGSFYAVIYVVIPLLWK